MLATAGPPPDDPGRWAVEMKWDGIRGICRVSGGRVDFYSRNRNNITAPYPELAAAIAELAGRTDLILDGEIIAPDLSTGAPSFTRFQRRMHSTRPTGELVRAVPVQLFCFDLLELGGENIMPLPYIERRARLSELGLIGPSVRIPPYWTQIPIDTMLDTVASHALEGIVSKRLDSVYRPGMRSRMWLKTALRRTTDVIIVGWVPTSSGGESGALGSLVLGAHDERGRLVYVGHVGTGFTTADRRTLCEQLAGLAVAESPFDLPAPTGRVASARWVQPRLVGTVEYREFAGALRHPSWRGLREEIHAINVRLPSSP
ncbi:ATP-dependent DNA ligase [Nocardia sp. NBC_00881]|nr:ATP-dependent DNA ligase [Nocardia sp. NBC_00881]